MNDGNDPGDAERQAARDGDPPRPVSDHEARQERLGLWILAALVLSFSAIGAYGIEQDNGPLEVLAFCGAMPTLLGFLVLLGMHMTWLD